MCELASSNCDPPPSHAVARRPHPPHRRPCCRRRHGHIGLRAAHGCRANRAPRARRARVWQPNSGHGSLGSLGSLGGKFSEANSNGKRNVARERRQGTSPVNVAWKRRPRGNVATESYTRGRVEGTAGVAYVLGTRTGARCTVRTVYLASIGFGCWSTVKQPAKNFSGQRNR